MLSLRTYLSGQPALAMLILALALTVRAVVPAGYMPGSNDGARTITVMLCADANAASTRISIPMDGSSQSGDDKPHASDSPCSFGALAMGMAGGADAALLDVAIRHILALGFAPVAIPVLQGFFRLRPPLRGPPSRF